MSESISSSSPSEAIACAPKKHQGASEHSIRIASLNVGCAKRDEDNNPLYKRLPNLKAFIKKHVTDAGFHVFCMQEIRYTGPLSARDLIREIEDALGPTWESVQLKVNAYTKAFHRVTFWDSSKYMHLNTEAVNVCANERSSFTYMQMISQFTHVNAKTNVPLFSVNNVHAPMDGVECINYWQCCKDNLDFNGIAIGDMNKFEERQNEFSSLFSPHFMYMDHIPFEMTTFASFDADRDSQHRQWRSSLDSVITHTQIFNVDINVVSTEGPEPGDTGRVADHFLIQATLSFKPIQH
jgi:hypothetical protein